MANELTVPTYHAQLPAFLRNPALFEQTDKAIAGIGGGMPAFISIRGAKFHFVSADGAEAQVNQLSLDVIVLTGNEHVSKSYYAGAYDPAQGGGVPPTCFSDNGSAPSTQAMSPQNDLCATCKFNAWGSKVTPTGSQVKACTDSKKLAVVLAADTPTIMNGQPAMAKALGQVYLLRVPAASMGNWKDFGKMLKGYGAPVIGCITQLSFDAAQSYPALLFKATGFITEAIYKQIEALPTTPAVLEAIGALDLPRVGASPDNGVPAPGQIAPPLPTQPAPVAVSAPAPAMPAPPAAAAPAAPTATRAPGRPRKETAPAVASPPQTAGLFPTPGGNGNGVIVAPVAASSELDALLAQTLGPQA